MNQRSARRNNPRANLPEAKKYSILDLAGVAQIHLLGVILVLKDNITNLSATILIIIVALFCTSTPSALIAFLGASITLPETGSAGITLTTLWTILAVASLFVRHLASAIVFPLRLSHIALVVFWSWMLLAAIWNCDWYLFSDITKSIVVAVLAYAVIRANKINTQKAVHMLLLGLSVALTSIGTHYVFYKALPSGVSEYTGALRLKFLRNDPNASAMYLGVLAAGLFGSAAAKELTMLKRTMLVFSAIAIAALIPFTLSRGGVLSLCVLVMVSGLLGRRMASRELKWNRLPLSVLPAILLSTVLLVTTELGSVVLDRVAQMVALIGQRGLDTRGQTFRSAFDAICEAPLFGPGFQKFTEYQLSRGLLDMAYAHNTVLDMGLGGGLMGGAMFAVLAVVPFIYVWRRKPSGGLFTLTLIYTVVFVAMQSLSMPSDKVFWTAWLLIVTEQPLHAEKNGQTKVAVRG